jgi:hypothetical protein
LCGAQLAGFLKETNPTPPPPEKIKVKTPKEMAEDSEEVPNPALDIWKAQEQQVLSYLLTSVSCDVLVQVATLPTTTIVWKHLETSLSSMSLR